MTKRSVHRPVVLLALTRCLLEVQFWFPLWLVFLLHRGFDLTTAVLADGLFRIVSVFAEVPMGIVSDWLGRKRTYLSICVLTTITFLAISMVHGVLDLLVVWAVWGVLWALNSGAATSYLYELAEPLGPRGSRRAFGMVRGLGQCAVLFSLVSAGWLYAINPAVPFVLTAVLAAMAGCLACFLPDVERQARRPTFAGIRQDLRAAVQGEAARMIIGVAAWFLFVSWSARILFQPLALDVGLDAGMTSLMYALCAGVEMLGALAVGWIASKYRAQVMFTALALTSLACFATGFFPVMGPFLWLPVLSLAWGLGWTSLEYEVASVAAPAVRATLLSIVSMVGGLGIAVARPALGIVAERWSAGTAFLAWGMSAAVVAAITAPRLRRWVSAQE